MKALVILTGLSVAVLLAALLVTLIMYLIRSSGKSGERSRLIKAADRQLEAAAKASLQGRTGLAEDHMELHRLIMEQLKQL